MPENRRKPGEHEDKLGHPKPACQYNGEKAFTHISRKHNNATSRPQNPKGIGEADIAASMLAKIDSVEAPTNY
jgi:hypothetical protein